MKKGDNANKTPAVTGSERKWQKLVVDAVFNMLEFIGDREARNQKRIS